MPLIETKSFLLSTYEAGSDDASRLALVLPGRLESKDYAHIQSHVTYLAALGYHALAFDPPGSWESQGDIGSYNVTNYLAATNELIEYYDSKPTTLIGHSLGGSIAMLAAAQNPSVVSFISLMSAVGVGGTDKEWETEGKITFYRDLPPGDVPTPKAQQKRFDLPYSYLEDAGQYDTEAAIKSCTKPKLFIMGIYDTQNTQERVIQHTFDVAAEPKQLIKVPCGHGYRYSKVGIEEINKLIGAFVTQQNK